MAVNGHSDARVFVSFLAVLLSLGLAGIAGAATITVSSTLQSPGGAGDCTLGEAIIAANTDAAVDGCAAGSGVDTIMLPAGTYTMTAADNPDNALPAVTEELTIQGAGAGVTIIERDLAAAPFRFIQNTNGALLSLSGLTMRNGNAPGDGGAVNTRNLAVNGSVFTNNTAGDQGGALGTGGFASTISVTNSTFTNNVSSGGGGALQVFGALTVTGAVFDSNVTDPGVGGAIHHQGGLAVVSNTSFTNNRGFDGGGMASTPAGGFAGTVNITLSNFIGNSATATVGNQQSGGGLWANEGSVTDSTFSGNDAVRAGGGIFVDGPMTITGSTVSLNSATFGGGVSAGPGVVTITNSTVSSNAALNDGGGLYTGPFSLNNVTVANNIADSDANGNGDGGGIYAGGPAATLVNTILAGNHDGLEVTVQKTDNPDPATTGSPLTYTVTVTKLASSPDCFGSIASNGFNLIGIDDGCAIAAASGDVVGTGGAPVDPRLGPLQNNGGPTETHALEVGSAAIDGGNDLVAPGGGGDACLATDQRGVPRPAGPRCDIGAFEGSVPASASGPSTGFTVIDTLPGSVTFVSATPSQGTCTGTSTVTCRLGPIANGETPTIEIVVTPTAAGTVTNNVTVAATTIVAAPTASSSEDTLVMLAAPPPATADLSINKTDAPDPVTAGGNITWTITVTNAGPSTATNVVVMDPIPAGATFVSASAGCTGTSTVTCTTASLASGASVVHTIVASTSTTGGGAINNTATVTATETDPNPANNASTSSTTVTPVDLVAVPTAGFWALVILATLLALFGAVFLGRF